MHAQESDAEPRAAHRSAAPRLAVIALGFRGFPGIQGGIETHAEQLYPRLAELGCDIEAIVRSPYMPGGAAPWRGVRFRSIWSPRLMGIEAALHSLFGVIYAIARRPDVLHIHGVGPALFTPLARLFRLRVVVTHHGADYDREKWGRVAKAVLRLGEFAGMRCANARIAVSGAIAETILRKHGIDAVVIRNGVSLPQADASADCLAPLGLAPQRYFLCVGRLVPEKRHLDLIEAFRRAALSGWRLAIVGATVPQDAHVRRVVAAAAETPGVVCTGFQSGEALAQLFAHAAQFVLPSSHEGLPIALLEALSYGLAVVASDIPAHRELDLDSDAYFPVGNVEELAGRLVAAASRPTSEFHRRERRRRVAELCDWGAAARATLAVFQENGPTLDEASERPRVSR
jgi:glycosyltransferase involved in cell wall biosynthesis